MLAILRSETHVFPTSTVIIEQYRPPVDAYVVGERCHSFARWSCLSRLVLQNFPLVRKNHSLGISYRSIVWTTSIKGLIDEGETPEQAAVRELEEETGYKAQKVIESSPVLVADPG